MPVVGAVDVTNGDFVAGAVEQMNGVAGLHLSCSLDSEVRARSPRVGEPADEGGVSQPYAELEAGDAGLGHPCRDAADLPALPDTPSTPLPAYSGAPRFSQRLITGTLVSVRTCTDTADVT